MRQYPRTEQNLQSLVFSPQDRPLTLYRLRRRTLFAIYEFRNRQELIWLFKKKKI